MVCSFVVFCCCGHGGFRWFACLWISVVVLCGFVICGDLVCGLICLVIWLCSLFSVGGLLW